LSFERKLPKRLSNASLKVHILSDWFVLLLLWPTIKAFKVWLRDPHPNSWSEAWS
jgi:hypothetical protein